MALQLGIYITAVTLLWVITKTPALAAPSLAKDGCESQCGDVSIPYPFGINSGCYIDDSYSIECRTAGAGAPKPFLKTIDLEVLEISILDGYVIVNNPVMSWNCPNSPSGSIEVDLGRTNFVFSETANRFVAVGCNNLAFLWDHNGSRIGGCMSICDPNKRNRYNWCYGINCCQTTIPVDLQTFNATFKSIDQNNQPPAAAASEVQSCTYAFLVEQRWFLYNLTDPFAVENMTHVPADLEWRLPYNSTALTDITFSAYCWSGSSINGTSYINSGVRCSCRSGYEGNPYLPFGCQDVCWNNPGDPMCNRRRINGRRKSAKMAIIGVCSGLGGLLLLIGAWGLYHVIKKRNNSKRKEKFFKRNGGLLLQQQLTSSDGNVEKTKLFSSEELEKATDHYNEDRILGQGGQGTVYKGMLSDGRIVAVKKSKILDEGNVEQFINEVFILWQIVHRNVVKLLGCCLETEVPMLVYEFISNGTLLHRLNDPNDQEFPLSWETRLRIATEVAGALSYLHNAAAVPIYHRDIKSTNILLDDKYQAKVSDFGTSRSVAIDQTHLTTVVQGTFGYLDPEYFQSSQFTDKSDVYSFGVVVVELLTGQKAISSTRSSQEGRSLATYFIQSMEENRLIEILDSRILKEGRREEMAAVASLAKRCLNLNGKKRPAMREVAAELEGIRRSHGGYAATGQDYEEVECNTTDLTEAWEAASTSTGTFFNSGKGSSFDIEPLLLSRP